MLSGNDVAMGGIVSSRAYDNSRAAILSRLTEQLTHNFVPPIKHIRDMSCLIVADARPITTFEPISEFPQIEHITFRDGMTIKDLSGIEKLPHLRSIRFESKVKVKKGIERVFEAKTLEELVMCSDFESLVNLQPSVRTLRLLDDYIVSLPPVPKSAHVEELWVGKWKHCLASFESLSYYPHLKSLHVSNSKTIQSLDGIDQCKDLEILVANFLGVSDLAPLQACKKLAELRIRKSHVTSLAPLYPMKTLRTLYAEKTRLRSIEGIADNLPNLELLWVFDTNVKDLTPLRGMKKLRELSSWGLKSVKDWEFLLTLPCLETLDLHRTTFMDVDILLSMPRLKYVLLSESGVSNDSPKLRGLGDLLKSRGGGYSFTPSNHWERGL